MISNLFMGISLLGAEWVLFLLLAISIASVALIFERIFFYRTATAGMEAFRKNVRQSARSQDWNQVLTLAKDAPEGFAFEREVATALAEHRASGGSTSPEVLSEIASDALTRTKIRWEKNLAILATVGNNAPFVGLFGTVLGIIQAFHNLSKEAAAGATTVTAGLSEALIATAVGILVAIPAVVAFNLFQQKVRRSLGEAEALKSYLVGQMQNTQGK